MLFRDDESEDYRKNPYSLRAIMKRHRKDMAKMVYLPNPYKYLRTNGRNNGGGFFFAAVVMLGILADPAAFFRMLRFAILGH